MAIRKEPRKSVDITRIPGGSYMDAEQLAYVRDLLILRISSTRDSAEHHRQSLVQLDSPSDESDSGTVEDERRRLLAEVDRNNQHLLELAGAIRRTNEGEYGYCEATSEEISLERLQAMPWAAYSVYSQEVLEHRLATTKRA